MKRKLAVVLIGLLIAPPASAVQKPNNTIDWQRVQKLTAGTEIVLTVTGGQPTKVRLLFADEAALVTLKATDAKLPGRVREVLFGLGAKWPAIFAGLTYTDDRVRVSQDGVFDHDKKLAEFADVVQQTPRGSVQEIAEPQHSHFWRNVVIGVTAGAAVVVVLLLRFAPDPG